MSSCFKPPSFGVICYAALVTGTVALLVFLAFVCVCILLEEMHFMHLMIKISVLIMHVKDMR